jgi:hypothetical protein
MTSATLTTFEYFQHYSELENPEFSSFVDYHWDKQFENYKTGLNFETINKLTTKYFSPSEAVKNNLSALEAKYSLDYDKLCVLFFRGNDKATETALPSFDGYITRARKIQEEEPEVRFLLQSDSSDFISTMLKEFPENSFYFKDEIVHMKKADPWPWTMGLNFFNDHFRRTQSDPLAYAQMYLAITIAMSKCKYVIFGSGNCSVWIVHYRGNANNVQQFLNGQWLT